jgi:hypothetical protein
MKLSKHADITGLLYTGKEPCIYCERQFGVRVYNRVAGRFKFAQGYRTQGARAKRSLEFGEYPATSRDEAEDVAASYRATWWRSSAGAAIRQRGIHVRREFTCQRQIHRT